MSNTSSNFEIAGVLLGKEVRKRKTPQKKNRNYSTAVSYTHLTLPTT